MGRFNLPLHFFEKLFALSANNFFLSPPSDQLFTSHCWGLQKPYWSEPVP